jgi:biopolymer transport protein ExbD
MGLCTCIVCPLLPFHSSTLPLTHPLIHSPTLLLPTMYLPEEPEEDFELNIVPMIDVIFAILTFFIISSLFLTRSESLPVNLPQAASAELQERSRIAVSVDETGEIALNREAIALENLQTGVRDLMGSPQESVIVINADEAVSHGRVIAVMDELREIEGATLGIATRQPE